jgi:hypothetical protein
MMMKFRRNPAVEDRLKKLAGTIESVVEKDELRMREARKVAELRRQAAVELHSICSDFVNSVNRLLSKVMLDLGPPDYSAEAFRDPGRNVIQINSAGRLIQIEFQATDTPTSTEEFRIPYIIRGAVRCFNQEQLDRAVIPELHLFYCLDKGRRTWLLFDPRTHRTVPFDQECLISLMERLV